MGLPMKASIPDCRCWATSLSNTCADMAMTGSERMVRSAWARMRCVASMPSMPGRLMSIEDEVERLILQELQAFLGGRRDQRPVPHPGDEGLDHHRVDHVVLDDEDAQRAGRPGQPPRHRLGLRRERGGFAARQRQREAEAASRAPAPSRSRSGPSSRSPAAWKSRGRGRCRPAARCGARRPPDRRARTDGRGPSRRCRGRCRARRGTPESGSAPADRFSVTAPRSVNLMPLPSRLRSTWLSFLPIARHPPPARGRQSRARGRGSSPGRAPA